MAGANDPTERHEATGALLSIGVFARRSRLSPKALRLYERLGLLPPAYVAPDSGYRWYRTDQLTAARLVALLRRLDMPLAQIGAVVAAPGPRGAELIATHWAATEERIAAQRTLATYLRANLSDQEGDFAMFEIQERDVPEQFILTEQRHVQIGEMPAWLDGAIGRLRRIAAAQGGATALPFIIYHGEVNEDSDGPVEVCLPIAQEGATTDLPLRREPAHREAYTRVTKAQYEFPQILGAYDAVTAWMEAHGLTMADSPREVHIADIGTAAQTDEVCDVAFPVR